jgi:DNA repair protein RadC
MNNKTKINNLPLEERPYEKCERFGPASLSDAELLAIMLRTGTREENSIELAKRILYPMSSQDGVLNLHKWSIEQLVSIKGIGRVKAIQIVSLLELAKRLSKATATQGLSFSNPASIAMYYMEEMRHHKQEVMKLLLLNTKNKLICGNDISKGTVNTAVISPRELFVEALQKNAVSIILIHNHPSGDSTPSKEDVLITKRIAKAGEMIGIELLDHIVIGNNCFTSLREKKLL